MRPRNSSSVADEKSIVITSWSSLDPQNGTRFTRRAGLQHALRYEAAHNNENYSEFGRQLAWSGASAG